MTEDPRRTENIGNPLKPRVFITNPSRDHATYTPSIISVRQALEDGTALILDPGDKHKKGPRYLVTLSSTQGANQSEQKISVVTHGDSGKIETVRTTLIPAPDCSKCGGELKAETVEGEPLVAQVDCPHCQRKNPAQADPVTIIEDVAFFSTDPFHKSPDKIWTPDDVQNMFTFMHRTNRFIQEHVLAFMDQSKQDNPVVSVYDISRYDEQGLRNLHIQTETDIKTVGNPVKITDIHGVKMQEPEEEEESVDEINIFDGYTQTDAQINDLYDVHEIKSPQGNTYRFLTEWDGDEAVNIIVRAADLVGSGWTIQGTFDPADPEMTYDDLGELIESRNLVNRKKGGEIEPEESAFEFITVEKAKTKGGILPWQMAMKEAGIEVRDGVYLIVSIPDNMLSNLTVSYDPTRVNPTSQ